MVSYRSLNNLVGWIVFLIASAVYILTTEPTTSFWDCGEYIATAYKLQVGHPPGAPFFQILGRIFSLFAFEGPSQVAQMINIMSALSSSFTILFLFWSITMLARKLVNKDGEMTSAKTWTILTAGIIGSLAYTFTDSFWFSAVEGEVYAMSSFFTAVVFWAALRWEQVADQPHADRWLILIAYLVGLSIGVHLLNLLAIPAIALIVFFRKYKKQSIWRILLVFVISLFILAAIMYGIIPETITLFASTELLFVNTFGLPFHSGTIFFSIVLVGILVVGLLFSRRPSKRISKWLYVFSGILGLLFLAESDSAGSLFFRVLIIAFVTGFFILSRKLRALQHSVILSIVFILIGYSSFLMLVIRSNAGTPINENSPKDAISLLSYLNREQYGDWPIFHGQYFNAPVVDQEDGKPVYIRDSSKGKYVIKDEKKGNVPVFDPEYTTVFPRMWNNTDSRYARDYKRWTGIRSDPQNKRVPTFAENLRFFFKYQIRHMYFRYFMWNFAGRQNAIQGHGDILDGNWLSGIWFFDGKRLGAPQDDLPDSLQSKARNKYYFLPLILGLVGLFYHYRKRHRDALIITVLFVMTGLAIVVYLNQHSPQPRERDYAYAASFYAFAIWIGLGVIYLIEIMNKFLKPGLSIALIGLLTALLVPVNMAYEGWDDHDRSDRYTALEMAKSYLHSCEPNAILFTNGDNDTFPLWYAQEVEGIRTDVRVCNLSLLSGDWYIDQMKLKVYDSDPVPFTLNFDQYKQGTRDVVYLLENENIKGHVELKDIFDILKKNPEKLRIRSQGQTFDYFPAKKFRVSVDSATIINNGILPVKHADKIQDLEWTLDVVGIQKNQLMVLDLLAHMDWSRPVYFSVTTGDDAYLGLKEYFIQEGMTYKLVPAKIKSPDHQVSGVNTDAMYDNLMNDFSIEMKDSTQFMSEENLRAAMNLRNIYGRLAIALVQEGKADSAIRVADRIVEIIPDNVIPYDFFLVPVADAYYKAGATDKGDEILKILMRHTMDELYYFFTFTGKRAEEVDLQRQQKLAMMREISQVAMENRRSGIGNEAGNIFEQYYQRYVGQSPNW